MPPADCPELARFLRGRRHPGGFTHREHVRMAFELLRRRDFPESLLEYSRALRVMLEKAGRPEAFNQTVTVAFLSLISERMQGQDWCDFETFARGNPDLLGKAILARWYRPQRLACEAARRTFVLPDPA
ncbi:MAG TPA: hypothetical protein VFK87_12620 [Steroidobacteraceae bacterium]|nr:hypothetical protein [Steroidobacteraceae bacterium]